jgi:hypothetical protein
MQDTVDQTHSAVPRTLADIKDARRAVCGRSCADSPAWTCSLCGTSPDGLHLAGSVSGVNRRSSSRPVGTPKSAGS